MRVVAELTDLVELDGWPEGSRLIVRASRFTAFLTDQPSTDLAALDLRHRGHARVEQRIRGQKHTVWANLPSTDYAINAVWVDALGHVKVQLAMLAADLLTFFAAICLDDPSRPPSPRPSATGSFTSPPG